MCSGGVTGGVLTPHVLARFIVKVTIRTRVDGSCPMWCGGMLTPHLVSRFIVSAKNGELERKRGVPCGEKSSGVGRWIVR